LTSLHEAFREGFFPVHKALEKRLLGGFLCMNTKHKGFFRELFEVDVHERWKVFFLTIAFFLIIGAYTFTRDLKSAIFMSVVGREYVPWAKYASMFILVPLILFYSTLVDHMRRYQLLAFCSLAFGIMSLIFTFLLGHPEIGISNTHTSPWRLFGWFFYFFVEGYSPFVVSVFWAFANSVSNLDSAKKNYGLIVSGSKVGGMFSAGLAWLMFSMSSGPSSTFTDVMTHQITMAISSIMLLLVPVVIWLLVLKVPGRLLHGYEAAYQVEKTKRKTGHSDTGMFAGLKMFFKYPYVLGIFGMVFFYEVVSTVLSYLRLGIAEVNAQTVSDVSKILFEIQFKTHVVGLIFSVFGTRMLHEKLGTRNCLMLIPLLMGGFLLYLMIATTPEALVNAFVAFKAIHYAFSWPVRESLYIPTVKEINFKSKSWIDAFGGKFARGVGSTFNIIASTSGSALLLPLHSFFFAGLIGLWFITSFLLGRRFDQAVSRNEVIGSEEYTDENTTKTA
jgi:AAA family ATP:ADP antiporter